MSGFYKVDMIIINGQSKYLQSTLKIHIKEEKAKAKHIKKLNLKQIITKKKPQILKN